MSWIVKSSHSKTTHTVKAKSILGENEMLIQSEEMTYCEVISRFLVQSHFDHNQKLWGLLKKIPDVVCSIQGVQNEKEKVRSFEFSSVNTCIVETNHRNKMTDSKINLVSVGFVLEFFIEKRNFYKYIDT